jgi:hypothetical protein
MNALKLRLLALSVALPTISAPAQQTAPDALTWGGDFRLRNEYVNNCVSLDEGATGHEQDYYRIRTRLWMAWKPSEALALNARLAAEPRVWMQSPTISRQQPGKGLEERYGIVDNLNLKWTGQAGSWAVTCTAGRQDIMLGEAGRWWLVADGTPGDGSWTTFFDAIRVGFENKERGLKIDLSALQTRAWPDSSLPIIGPRNGYSLAEQNELGLIALVSADLSPKAQLGAYLILKDDDKVLSSGDDASIRTAGMRLGGSPSENWRYDVECAYQWGWKEDATIRFAGAAGRRDIRAWGANARLTHLFNDSLQNKLSLDCEYLSGDDPDTADDEMFDILWGRYPRFSDAFVFACAKEMGGRIAQMGNMVRIGPTWSFSPAKPMSVSVSYALLLAPESTPTRATSAALFSFDGHTRGHLWQVVAKYQFSKSLSGLVCAELLSQGDFYASGDTQCFIRVELGAKF